MLLSLLTLIYNFSFAQKPRARDIGILFGGTPGKFNAITDVKGVGVVIVPIVGEMWYIYPHFSNYYNYAKSHYTYRAAGGNR